MQSFRVELGQLLVIYASLVLFGIGFNAVTAWAERRGYIEGFTSLMVVIGVAVTLTPFLILDCSVLYVVGGFVCSGLPMIIGSIGRYMRMRARAQAEIARLHDGDNPPGMAE
jgi:hypothetical protein